MKREKQKYYARLLFIVLAALALLWQIWALVQGQKAQASLVFLLISISNLIGNPGKLRLAFIVLTLIFGVMTVVSFM
ncbi:hypothetical protein [Weissella sp. MSCH1]|uniref:hypothetical protein n=1 Tax=Weissella sp. MSCH1 TaxID=3383343 RepID=UPI0038969CA6